MPWRIRKVALGRVLPVSSGPAGLRRSDLLLCRARGALLGARRPAAGREAGSRARPSHRHADRRGVDLRPLPRRAGGRAPALARTSGPGRDAADLNPSRYRRTGRGVRGAATPRDWNRLRASGEFGAGPLHRPRYGRAAHSNSRPPLPLCHVARSDDRYPPSRSIRNRLDRRPPRQEPRQPGRSTAARRSSAAFRPGVRDRPRRPSPARGPGRGRELRTAGARTRRSDERLARARPRKRDVLPASLRRGRTVVASRLPGGLQYRDRRLVADFGQARVIQGS